VEFTRQAVNFSIKLAQVFPPILSLLF